MGEARKILEESEVDRLAEGVDVTKEAIAAVEESGIVFIDEVDKLISTGDHRGADASSEGVQRDLLPIIEGCTINTRYGNVNTDYILFIASGAFHSAKPSDLLAELQGRLPIRVTLQPLTEEDLVRVLTEPQYNLLAQQKALLKTEGVDVVFTEDSVKEMAKIAFECNRTVENIGARRLHTVVEKVMEALSFDADEHSGNTFTVDAAYVRQRVGELMQRSDLKKYIL